MRTEKGAIKGLSRLCGSPIDEQEFNAHPSWSLSFAQEANRQGPNALVESARRLLDWPLEVELAQVEMPVAIWHGQADRLVAITHSRFLADRLPQGRLEEVPNHAHVFTPAVLSSIANHLASSTA